MSAKSIWGHVLRFFCAALVTGVWGASARADIIVRGNAPLAGKVVSRTVTELVFQPDSPGAASFHLDLVARPTRILITDEHGALISDSEAPATQEALSWNPPSPPVAPKFDPPTGKPTYLVIPLHGEVGETVLAKALEQSLADALKRKPTVVVLDINSPGGLVEEAKQIIGVLHRYNSKLRIVALTDQDLSASAILSLSVREIYVKSTSIIGAATSYVPGNLMLPPKIEEKMQSAWRAMARNSAEEGKHDPLLSEAMIDSDLELHFEIVNGKPVVKEGPGDHLLCRKGRILTLSSHEAVDCGLASGEADDLEELGKALKFENWTQVQGVGTLLADSLPKRNAAFKAEMDKIQVRFQKDFAEAVSSDPSDSVTSVTRVTRVDPNVDPQPGRPVYPVPGRRPVAPGGVHQEIVTVTHHRTPEQWRIASLICTVALQRAEADIKDTISLCGAYDRTSEVTLLTEALGRISAIRSGVYDDRNRPEHQDAPVAAVPPAKVPGAAPAVAPRQPVTMPPGSVKTEVVGGPGGNGFITASHDDKPLLGFRWSPSPSPDNPVMQRIFAVAVARTAPLSPNYHEVMAKDGYVVGGMIVDENGLNVVAFKVIFVAYSDGKLNPKDSYESDWQGTPDRHDPKTLAGHGELVLGIVGNRDLNQTSIGLIVKPGSSTTP